MKTIKYRTYTYPDGTYRVFALFGRKNVKRRRWVKISASLPDKVSVESFINAFQPHGDALGNPLVVSIELHMN